MCKKDEHQNNTDLTRQEKKDGNDDNSKDTDNEQIDGQMERDQHNFAEVRARYTSRSSQAGRHFYQQRSKNVTARRLPFTIQADCANDTESTEQENDVVVEPADEEDHPVRSEYQSLKGKWAAFVLGDKPDVREYDKLRIEVKRGDTEKTAQFMILRDNLYEQLVWLMRDLQSAVMKGDTTKQTQERRRVVQRLLLRWHD